MEYGARNGGELHDGRQRPDLGENGASVLAVSGHHAGDGRKVCHALFALVKKPMEMMLTTTAATPSAE